MSIVAIKNYMFSKDEKACLLCCDENLYVVVRAMQYVFVMCPKYEIDGLPTILYVSDITDSYTDYKDYQYYKYIGIALREVTYQSVNSNWGRQAHESCLKRSLSFDLKKAVKKWSDKALNKAKEEPVNTTVIVKLDDSTYVMLGDNGNNCYLAICDGLWISFNHNSYILGVNNDYNSLDNFIGRFVLQLFPKSNQHKSPTLKQRFTIGSTFRKYRKWEETKGGF